MKPMIYMTLIASLLFAPGAGAQDEYSFEPYTLKDQHGNEHRLNPDTRIVIMSFQMSLSKSIHEWLATKNPDYLAQHNAEYVVDITPMPAIITRMFAGPKMKRYPFPIIQADNENFAKSYPHRDDKITVFQLDDSQKEAVVSFVSSAEEIQSILEPQATTDQ